MKKSKDGFSGRNTQRTIEYPEMIDVDVLTYMMDEDVDRRCRYLQHDRDIAARAGLDLYSWDVEICYAQRESQLRHDRREAHSRYLANL